MLDWSINEEGSDDALSKISKIPVDTTLAPRRRTARHTTRHRQSTLAHTGTPAPPPPCSSSAMGRKAGAKDKANDDAIGAAGATVAPLFPGNLPSSAHTKKRRRKSKASGLNVRSGDAPSLDTLVAQAGGASLGLCPGRGVHYGRVRARRTALPPRRRYSPAHGRGSAVS